MKNRIVISAVNIVEGGALSVLQDCLENLAISQINKDYDIIALVNSSTRLSEYDNIKYLEYPKTKKHYLYRLYYEYFAFYWLSKRLKPRLWLSLHDMSPVVDADIQAVYMHNPTPFYKPTKLDWKYLPINAIWAYLYKFVYRINIHSNKFLVVQQDWLRCEFSKMFNFEKDRIIVARPVHNDELQQVKFIPSKDTSLFQFVYPAFPRVFKNFEVICEAARIIENSGIENVRIVLTVDGSENKYSRYLIEKYGNLKLIDFIGLVNKKRMEELYNSSDCLIFPSKLETWGLPLSEFKPYNRPIIAADLPYAHESAAGASMVRFFNPNNASELVNCIKSVVSGDLSTFCAIPNKDIDAPSANSWKELFDILLES